jgi:hypothetical protein
MHGVRYYRQPGWAREAATRSDGVQYAFRGLRGGGDGGSEEQHGGDASPPRARSRGPAASPWRRIHATRGRLTFCDRHGDDAPDGSPRGAPRRPWPRGPRSTIGPANLARFHGCGRLSQVARAVSSALHAHAPVVARASSRLRRVGAQGPALPRRESRGGGQHARRGAFARALAPSSVSRPLAPAAPRRRAWRTR